MIVSLIAVFAAWIALGVIGGTIVGTLIYRGRGPDDHERQL